VGGSKTIKVDVRVLATTNRDLKRAVAEGSFGRICTTAECGAGVRASVEGAPGRYHDAGGSDAACGVPELWEEAAGFSNAAREAMLRHDWPGNVRELQNTIERAVILSEENHLIEPACLALIHLLDPASSSPAPAAHAAIPPGNCGIRKRNPSPLWNGQTAGGDRAGTHPAGAGANEGESDAGGEPVEDQHPDAEEQAERV